MPRVPILREVAWVAVLPQLIILGAFIALAAAIRGRSDNTAVILGAGAYLILSFTLRYTLTAAHRTGIRLMRHGRFDDAIPHFERSARFFERHAWLDRFRALTLLSAARMTYREMAMCNVAFAHSQLGRGDAAKKAYERVLADYPENSLATAALRMIKAAESTEHGGAA